MTGRELIKWIQDNHAEDFTVIIQYRDGGGKYSEAERLGDFGGPALCTFSNETRCKEILEFNLNAEKPDAIIL